MAKSSQQPDEPLHHGRMSPDEMEAAIKELLAWKASMQSVSDAINAPPPDFNRAYVNETPEATEHRQRLRREAEDRLVPRHPDEPADPVAPTDPLGR